MGSRLQRLVKVSRIKVRKPGWEGKNFRQNRQKQHRGRARPTKESSLGRMMREADKAGRPKPEAAKSWQCGPSPSWAMGSPKGTEQGMTCSDQTCASR